MTAIAGQLPNKITTLEIAAQSSTSLAIKWQALLLSESGGLAINTYLVRTDEADYIMSDPVSNGDLTAFTRSADIGKTYRFRVAAKNVLGVGPWSDEI
jgi:hypothetical protein